MFCGGPRMDACYKYSTLVFSSKRRRCTRAASRTGALKDIPARARIVITTRLLGAAAAGWLSHLSGLFYSRCCYNRFLVPHTSGLPLPHSRRARDYISCSPIYPPPAPTADRRPPSALLSRLCFFPTCLPCSLRKWSSAAAWTRFIADRNDFPIFQSLVTRDSERDFLRTARWDR